MKLVITFLIGALLGVGVMCLYHSEAEVEYDAEAGSCEGSFFEEAEDGRVDLEQGSQEVAGNTRSLVEGLLAQNLGQRRFSFADVVRASAEKEIYKYDAEQIGHRTIVQAVEDAVAVAIKRLNLEDSPIRGLRRVNEASRYFEDILMTEIDAVAGLSCRIPKTSEGKEQRSGYPDLRIEHEETGTVAYLDPKLFEETSIKSSLRTFYFEPRIRTSKIQDDALHLLLGIAHDGQDGQWTFTKWHLVDLYEFQVKMKAEFQGSNRDLYTEELMIRDSR